jgi:ribosome-associated protein
MADPIIVDERVSVPASAIQVSAVRSSGPGGQNVNKVSSKIDMRVDLGAVTGLDVEARARLMAKAAPRLDAEGRLLVTSQKTRDQGRNLADAYEKVRALIAAAMVKPEVRRPTKPSRGAVRRRLTEKKQTAQRKQQRSARHDD